MWKTNENTIKGRGRVLRRNHFSDGVVRERDGGRDRFLLLGKEHETPAPRRSRRPNAKDVTMQANSYRDSFRSIKMCYLTHGGLEGLDVDFFLHKNKVLDSVGAGVQVHRLRETGAMEQLCHSNAFFSSTLLSSASSRSRRGLQRPAPHAEGVAQARKKKCGFMVCCRECIPVWWGAS